MFPSLWIFDTYSIMLVIGVLASFLLFYLYAKSRQYSRAFIYDILITGCISVIVGILSATLFQLLFNALKGEVESYFAMTFFGGLAGGAICFLLIYFLKVAKRYPDFKFIDFLMIAPSCITIAHGFGRIGCFLAGCCYGIETTSILGVTFPGHNHPRYPTQLFEAGFLFILSAILFFLAYKKHNKYTMSIYLIGYGIFRFLIEFIRGDDRGAYLFNVLSPSQVFSILAFTIGIVLMIIFIKKYELKEK